LKFDKLTNQELFDWLRRNPRSFRAGIDAIEDRWKTFWNKARTRLFEMDRSLKSLNDAIDKMDDKIHKVETLLKYAQQDQKKLSKRRTDARLRLIQNNLQSVTRQLEEKNPRPYIPESTWEAFEEFLIKLNVK
jgi:chromosome segregation ATPase